MFFMNECVQSCRHGMGIVVRGGHDPVVQFLDGPRLRVMGKTLRIIPDHVYDAEILNRAHVERWLNWRIHGVVRPAARLIPRARFDLVGGIKETAHALYAPEPLVDDDATGALWFAAKELTDHQVDRGNGSRTRAMAPKRIPDSS